MDVIFSETQRFNVRRKFEDYKYIDLDKYLKISELPETWKSHEKEFRQFLKDCDISDNSIETGYDKLSLFYIIFLTFNLLKNNVKVIINNFGYSLHPLLRRQLLFKFSKYENLCLMTNSTDTVNELLNISDPRNFYVNILNVQENEVLFNDLLTLEECKKKDNLSEDVKSIIDRVLINGGIRPWITML